MTHTKDEAPTTTADASEPQGRLSPVHSIELGMLEETIVSDMAHAPAPRTTGGGLTLILSPEATDTPEWQEAAARHVAYYAAALRYLVSEGLTGGEYAQPMFAFRWVKGAYWIWHSRAEHLADERETFGAAVLRAAGFGN